MSSYQQENRSLNLNEKSITGFVSLNGLNGDTEIVNIYIANNDIDIINVSEYPDLGRLDISGNNITFFADLKLPNQIRHLVLADNNLQNLDGIELLTELKTLDISGNRLDEADLKQLANLPKLQFIKVEGNEDISPEMTQQLNEFNIKYLQSTKQL